jgi:molybdopterin converting factor small subunit
MRQAHTTVTTDPATATRNETAAATTVIIRYFAAARAESGIDEETVSSPTPATLSAVLDDAVARHGEGLRRVLSRCSYLRNATAVHDVAATLDDGDQLDVLPPFAGG